MQTASIVGSGPNGLSAAIRLAQAGVKTTVFEQRATIGGAVATGEVTLPGFRHDLGASIFPMSVASPFLRGLPLGEHGLRWIEPPAPLAHPLDDGSAVMLEHDLAATAANLDGDDRGAWQRLLGPLAHNWPQLCDEILAPVMHMPKHPLVLAGFGAFAAMPATVLARMLFRGARARALFSGNAAHGVTPLDTVLSSAVGLVLATAGHATGWPIAAGGAQSISDALAGYFRSLGGTIVTNYTVTELGKLPGGPPSSKHAVLCDVTPQQLLALDKDGLSASYRRKLKGYQYGPGAFKVDWALSDAIPWRAKECLRAATVHVGGTMEEIARSERAAWDGVVDERPFVLVAQPSLFDATRAPEGGHTAWGYCHVPNGSGVPRLDAIEAQIERFAPGFRECILARNVMSPAVLEAWNPNLVGGDLGGGAMNMGQLIFRPTAGLYRTSRRGLYLASSSTPPGGGVHGMCGFYAANAALRDLR